MRKQVMRILATVLCAAMLLGDGSIVYATSGMSDSLEESSENITEEVSEEATEEVTEAAEESETEDKDEEAEAEDKAEESETEDKAEEAEAEDKVEEAEAEDKAEEPAEEKAEAPVFVAPPEAVEKLALNEEFFENIVTELPEDELVITPDGTEPLVVAVVEEDVVEEEVAEVPEEDKFSFGDLDDVEETSEETEEIFIENAEDPDSKWTFNNSMSNTLRGQEENAKRYEFIAKELGQNVVTEEAVEEETVVEEAAEDTAEEVEAVAAEEPATEEKETVEQPVAAVVAQPVVEEKAENRFTITNSGSGISPEYIQHIFERFYQASRKKGSTGLGLALVAAVCRYYNLRLEYFFADGKHHFEVEFSE